MASVRVLSNRTSRQETWISGQNADGYFQVFVSRFHNVQRANVSPVDYDDEVQDDFHAVIKVREGSCKIMALFYISG